MFFLYPATTWLQLFLASAITSPGPFHALCLGWVSALLPFLTEHLPHHFLFKMLDSVKSTLQFLMYKPRAF